MLKLDWQSDTFDVLQDQALDKSHTKHTQLMLFSPNFGLHEEHLKHKYDSILWLQLRC